MTSLQVYILVFRLWTREQLNLCVKQSQLYNPNLPIHIQLDLTYGNRTDFSLVTHLYDIVR